ncbi:hypothetical protein HFD88_007262 [Aspergillus terreus]|nr:hypothetical protein HFD88_007262 [Aspergillus terreus]
MSGSSNQSTRTSPGSYSTTTQRTHSVSSGASPPHSSLPSSQAPSTAQNAMSTDVYNTSVSQPPASLGPSFTYPFASIGGSSAFDPATMRLGDSDRSAQSLNGFVRSSVSGGAILMRNLPSNTSREALRSMLLFAKDLIDVDFDSAGLPDEKGYLSAIARFGTVAAAEEARALLNGKPNSNNDATMIVEMYDGPAGPSPLGGPRRNTIDHSATRGLLGSLSNGPLSRQSSRFNGTFQSLTATNASVAAPSDALPPTSEPGSRMHSLFSPQSPIGNGVHDLPRVSGKSMIDQDLDEETGELLKDPVGYAENGHSASARRATNPQFPTNQFAGLSLSTNISSPPPQNYTPGGSAQPQMGLPTPSSAYAPSLNSNMVGAPSMGMYGNPHTPRHSLPAANPNDMNPPCNTLYVGNLPPDASEEELKALFIKQRGYKRLCFRNKQNGPMCFVEFEDVGTAGKTLHELYGYRLSNSVKTGIRLSFSKNPLGVRSSQPSASNAAMAPQNAVAGGSSLGGMHNHVFSSVSGPPPGLMVPPGLGPRVHPHAQVPTNGSYNPNAGLGIRNPMSTAMSHTPPLGGGPTNGASAVNMGPYNNVYFHDYMMGR